METLRGFKKTVTINGMVKDAVVTIEVEQEEPDFSYWDKKDAIRTQKDLEAGQVECLWVLVRVQFSDLDGYEGLDSLGQVFVRPAQKDKLKDVEQTVELHTMMENAANDLVSRVLEGQAKLTEFLKPKLKGIA